MNQFKKEICLFLAGDVMTGRGIDQILTHPSDPVLYEPYITDARDYVLLGEQATGKIVYPVTSDYIWGDALHIWEEQKPDIKIINLETAVTQSVRPWPYKDIHYRMHPLNTSVLTAAGIDVCTLANNHILDWSYEGLTETITTLKDFNIAISGAGNTKAQAMAPVIINLQSDKRILIFSAGTPSSGIPLEWSATDKKPGVYLLSESLRELESIGKHTRKYKTPNDLVVFSLHIGSNWGYDVSEAHQTFMRGLIDVADIDVLFGHSSHHPRKIEIYKNKPILYGCGDFINDYEGISGHEAYRQDLTAMYFLYFDPESLQYKGIKIIPMQIRNFKLHRANEKDSEWLLKKIL